ncbi:myb protein [Salix suchowensis]|nr:myb protein [Salix suchowensis]
MGSFYNSYSDTSCNQRSHFSVERRPKMLKEFLNDDSKSCSSSGFKPFSGKPCDSTMKTLVEVDFYNPRNTAKPGNNIASYKLLKSRSKAAASTTVSAFQAMMNAVKNLHSIAVKSPSLFPRSLSRRLSKKKCQNEESEVKITVTVKDIMRWRSFRDIVEEKAPPSDLPPSPHHCTTTTTRSTSTTPRSGSSWCDSDFTSEYLPCWNGNSDESVENEAEAEAEAGKKFSPCVGEDSLELTTETKRNTKVGPKEDEEEQQHSPASVIEFQFEEDEESRSSFHQCLATLDRTREKIMEKIRRFENLANLDPVNLDKWMSMDENISSGEDDGDEEYRDDLEGIRETNMIKDDEEEDINKVEEKAWKLLNQAKETGVECCNDVNLDLLLNFFRDELATGTYETRKNGIDLELLTKAKAWIKGEDSLWVGWEMESKREDYVREMDREGRWKKFEEDQQELGLEIENGVLRLLVDDLLLDLISC